MAPTSVLLKVELLCLLFAPLGMLAFAGMLARLGLRWRRTPVMLRR